MSEVKKGSPLPQSAGEGVIHERLNEMLNFGPEKEESKSSNLVSERIRRLVEQLQDINRRIDKLSSRF